MLFEVPIAGANGDWDQWLLDLESGERRLLQAAMRHCGGCDGRFGPAYSPDGSHAYFSELIQDGLIYVADLAAGEAEVISEGRTEIDRRPIWSATGARLLYSDNGERVLVRDFAAGADAADIEVLAWPARFDATGTAIYSPAYSRASGPTSTTVVDATTFEVLTAVDGASDIGAFWFPRDVVTLTAEGPVLALEQAEDCPDGTTLYIPAVPDGRCLEAAIGATVSPDGRRVAFAVLLDRGSHSVPSEYRVLIADTETLEPVTMIEGALSYDAPPAMEWNATSTHLLVRWPQAFGL